MGADSVGYYRRTVLERADDNPGAALAYYGERGETPLVWRGAGAAVLGLSGTVTEADYACIFHSGGAMAADGSYLSGPRAGMRPGFELTVSAHKSVSLLGLLGPGWAEVMHRLVDAEVAGTMAYLEQVTAQVGARHGRNGVQRGPTCGLTWAETRHATSRAGDPDCHSHLLLAHVVTLPDGRTRALDTGLIRDHLHAATMYGRMAAARAAVDAGLAVEVDNGPSGRLRHWRVVGVDPTLEQVFSKREQQITAAVGSGLDAGYRARDMAARATRPAKRFESPDQLMPGWQAEMTAAGHPPARVTAAVISAGTAAQVRPTLEQTEVAAVVRDLVRPDGGLSERKVFCRRDVVVAAATAVYGAPVGELDRLVDATLANPECVPLLKVDRASERGHATAATLATERAIERTTETLMAAPARPGPPAAAVAQARAATEANLGGPLSAGQAAAVDHLCGPGPPLRIVVGVAGSGKSTCLEVVRAAHMTAGTTVLGTATSGQAAANLADAAGIPSSTVASLLWRIDHRTLRLDASHVIVLDEAGMTDDRDWLRLLRAVRRTGATLVTVGDHRQLGAVGPGGTFEALGERHPTAMVTLTDNLRQADPAERAALEQLRAGSVAEAVRFYDSADRLTVNADPEVTVAAAAAGWAADIADGHDTVLLAWTRANVADLNAAARGLAADAGRLDLSREVEVAGRRWAPGDRIVTLAPTPQGRLVTSQRGAVTATAPDAVSVRMDNGAEWTFGPDTIGRLDYGYALTVHRTQGATADRAHWLYDGGGRELGYVALSRARTGSTVYLTADDRATALEDLRRGLSRSTRERWVYDVDRPISRQTEAAIEARTVGATLTVDQTLAHLPKPAKGLHLSA